MGRAPLLPRFLVFLCLLWALGPQAAPLERDSVPPPLQPWVDWVLQAHPEAACPVRYDSARHECLWPGRLSLTVTRIGVGFVQSVHAAAPTRMALPGGHGQWPASVQIDEREAAVVEVDGRPVVALEAGDHTVVGHIPWARVPDALLLPPAVGLVDLTRDGQPVEDLQWRDGRLWLREQGRPADSPGAPEDSLRLEVARLIADGHPVMLTTELTFTVSGSAREIVAGRPVPDGFTPLAVVSPLPARLEPDGRLRIQVRPGSWTVRVTAHRIGGLDELSMQPQPRPWPDSEAWAYAASPADRTVRVEGVEQTDPRRTILPPEWHRHPAWRMSAGESLSFVTLRRGNPEPDPDKLALTRMLWLDFDGGAYTARDTITGTLNRTWRLSAQPPLALGQVRIDGEPQFITLGENERPGVEVRHGSLRLDADSRIGRDGSLPANGWGVVMDSVAAELQTPPGWRVIAVGGVDQAAGAWWDAWSLYDLFFLLFSTIAVARLWGLGWAAVALVGLTLVWQEPEAPRLVWLGVIAVVAVRRLTPAGGRLARLLDVLGVFAWVALALHALPFAVDQARLAFYPQLERIVDVHAPMPATTADVREDAERRIADAPMSSAGKAAAPPMPSMATRESSSYASPLLEPDPGAIVQTGPGLPDWQWRRTRLQWNGPVAPGETFAPYVLPPAAVSALRLLALVLLGLLAWRLVDRRPGGRRSVTAGGRGGSPPGAGSAAAAGAASSPAPVPATALVHLLAVAAVAGGLAAPAPAVAEPLPSPALLEELASRLLRQPHEAPRASVPRMGLRAEGEILSIDLQVQALQRTAVPLPVEAGEAWPVSVRLDGAEAERALVRSAEGQLWALVEPGSHSITIRVHIGGRDAVALPTVLRPQRVALQAPGWSLSGLDAQGVPGERLVLTRRRAAGEEATQRLLPGRLPPLARLTRTLRLGLKWEVQTVLTRLSPAGEALSVNVPLVPGEAVLSEGLAVDGGTARVVLPAGQTSMQWRSSLEPVEALRLQAAASPEIVEVWQLQAGPIWHVEFDGLAPVHHQGGRQSWLPTWHPWPGDTLRLSIERPVGAGGRTLTVDSSRLEFTPGAQRIAARLTLDVRSSQGLRHPIVLPAGAELQSVTIRGRSQSLRLSERTLTLPLDPGASKVEIEWQTAGGIDALWRTPVVDLGVDSVNARVGVGMPASRWVFWLQGPALGPAVLFWGLLVVVVALAVALARLGRGALPLGLASWLLLGIGLLQTSLFALLVVVAWLAVIHARGRFDERTSAALFNVTQVAIVVATVALAGVLYLAVTQSLLGWPDMAITGNGSTARELNWTLDRSDATLPSVLVASLPLIVYRVLMLLWALWLAFALLAWLRWAWPRFAHGGFWRSFGLPGLGRARRAPAAGDTVPTDVRSDA